MKCIPCPAQLSLENKSPRKITWYTYFFSNFSFGVFYWFSTRLLLCILTQFLFSFVDYFSFDFQKFGRHKMLSIVPNIQLFFSCFCKFVISERDDSFGRAENHVKNIIQKFMWIFFFFNFVKRPEKASQL